MKKIIILSRLGMKYLYRYRRRYAFLVAALVFGFAIITFISSVKDGMYDSVYYSAQSHYAGDIVALGYDPGSSQNHLGQKEIAAILDASNEVGMNPQFIVQRTLHGERGILHYNGTAVRLKYVIGCDWENEEHLFNKMIFDEIPDFPVADNGIILSVPVARQLGAKVGDSLILEVDTRWWQKNTGVFIVSGIVQDSSIFGYYKAYVSRMSLNRLILYDDDECSLIGFFLDDPGMAEQKRMSLHNVLSGMIATGPLVYDRDEMTRETYLPRDGIEVFLCTLPVYLSEISDLLSAMNIISYFLYTVMLLIILVSAAVTYRLILHERTKEMGTMRAIGFYGRDVRIVLWTEVIVLGLISLAAGFLLAKCMSLVLSLFSFSWFPSLEIFMKNGKFAALYLPSTVLINMLSIFLVLFAASLLPSLRASRKNLTGLLSGEPL